MHWAAPPKSISAFCYENLLTVLLLIIEVLLIVVDRCSKSIFKSAMLITVGALPTAVRARKRQNVPGKRSPQLVWSRKRNPRFRSV